MELDPKFVKVLYAMEGTVQLYSSSRGPNSIREPDPYLIHNYSILFLPKLKQHISMLFNHMLGICNKCIHV
jgi:hypothetical protein